jgi:hypothetical protein
LSEVGEVVSKTLFWLRLLNSVWILVSAVEGVATLCVGSVATRILMGFLCYYLFGLAADPFSVVTTVCE